MEVQDLLDGCHVAVVGFAAPLDASDALAIGGHFSGQVAQLLADVAKLRVDLFELSVDPFESFVDLVESPDLRPP